jgi:16S rRNA (cytosine967-C5)-methyltransferase
LFYPALLNTAVRLIKGYSGSEPLHQYLKAYFKTEPKHGSRDRKIISSWCYNYFRVAGTPLQDVEVKIALGTFLTANQPNALVERINPAWNATITNSLEQKLEQVKDIVSPELLFPYRSSLSNQVEYKSFARSFLLQPDLFIRLRPKSREVIKTLAQSSVSFEQLSDTTLRLANGSKLPESLKPDRDYVIQDYNSQRIAGLVTKALHGNSNASVWDCCAGSGGKSIMTYDLAPRIHLSVSDRRRSILTNLEQRFKAAGLTNYKSAVFDLTKQGELCPFTEKFDFIIVDAPCTGSGTWARTPEALHFFTVDQVKEYSALQKKMVQAAVSHLKPGGKLLYATCSVFQEENEGVTDFITGTLHLKKEESHLFKGYDIKADTLFGALFTL